MTVQQVIDELLKIEDKSIPIFIDCNYCGKAVEFKELGKVYLVKTTIIHRKD